MDRSCSKSVQAQRLGYREDAKDAKSYLFFLRALRFFAVPVAPFLDMNEMDYSSSLSLFGISHASSTHRPA
jgi:hypothetical protein